MTAPPKESRDAALNRINHHDFDSVDDFIAAVDRLARYIETGEVVRLEKTPSEVAAAVIPGTSSTVTNVMNVR